MIFRMRIVDLPSVYFVFAKLHNLPMHRKERKEKEDQEIKFLRRSVLYPQTLDILSEKGETKIIKMVWEGKQFCGVRGA